MVDIAKAAITGAWALVVGWILPVAIGLSLFGVLLLPRVRSVGVLRELNSASPSAKTITLVGASIMVGLALSAIQTPLYSILEGYLLWPTCLHNCLIAHHQQKYAKMIKEAERARDQQRANGGAVLTSDPRLQHYPDDPKQIRPTRLGNRIRALEDYSTNRYQLDTRRLWYHVRAVAPGTVAREESNQRAIVDFFVCSIYVLLALGSASLLTILDCPGFWPRLLLIGIGAYILSLVFYRGAVRATEAWDLTVRALIDLSREPLARAYGLRIPRSFDDERQMWLALGWWIKYPYQKETADALWRWRDTRTDTQVGSTWRRTSGRKCSQ